VTTTELKYTEASLTGAEYAARVEIYLQLAEHLSNGWADELLFKYRSPFHTDQILKEIKAITVAVLGSVGVGGQIVVPRHQSQWVGKLTERRLMPNLVVTEKYKTYNNIYPKGQRIRHCLVDSFGNRYLWDGSRYAKARMEKGGRYDIRATIREHLTDECGKYTRIVAVEILT